MELENIYNGNIAVVDLEAGEVEEIELEEEMVEKYLGGAALNTALYEQYKDRDPIVLGCGPLTSTLAPSSGMVVMTARSPLNGGLCHVPLTWQTAELKLTGFDFVVVLGKSETPVCLWLHDDIADLEDASETWGKDTWQTCDILRTQFGDDFIQTVVIGPAAEAGSPLAQLSENYWGSKDVFALGALLGEKKLKGICMRGLGTMEMADGFFETAVNLKNDLVSGQLEGKHGFKDMLPALGLQDGLGELFDKMHHRNASGHADFYAYHSFFMIDEDAGILEESKLDAPGMLVTDMAALAALKDLGMEIPILLKEITKLGLAPVATAAVLAKKGVTDAAGVKGELRGLASSSEAPADAGVSNIYGVPAWPLDAGEAGKMAQNVGLLSNAIPPQAVIGDFGLGDDPAEIAKWWLKRQAVGYIIGIDPLILVMAPEYTDDKIVDMIQVATEEDDFTEENLAEIVSKMFESGLAMLDRSGEVSSDVKAGDPDSLVP